MLFPQADVASYSSVIHVLDPDRRPLQSSFKHSMGSFQTGLSERLGGVCFVKMMGNPVMMTDLACWHLRHVQKPTICHVLK